MSEYSHATDDDLMPDDSRISAAWGALLGSAVRSGQLRVVPDPAPTDLPAPGEPCGYRWDAHECAELVQDPPATHTHRCHRRRDTMTFPYEELTASEQAAYDTALAEQIEDEELAGQGGDDGYVTAVATAIGDDGTAYLEDDTEVAAGNWTYPEGETR